MRVTLPLAIAFAAAILLLLVRSPDAALATVGTPPTVTCDAAQCETCLEYSGPDNRCLKCTHIEGCSINKGGGLPRSPIARYGRAIHDVDIYNSPVEPRKVIGMMRTDDEGPVMEQHPDGWSKLYLPALADFPSGGNGWVANDHLRFVIEK
jgi:hypothetical protein